MVRAAGCFFLTAVCLFVSPLGGGELPPAKVSPEILAHRRARSLPPGVSPARHLGRLKQLGLDTDDPSLERCALYVNRRLTAADVEDLAEDGILVNAWAWVPPVEGKHPFGFYLARVRYSSLEAVERDSRIVRLESTEFRGRWTNDLARDMVNASRLHERPGATALSGRGVKLAVADTGIDLGHADFPAPVEAFDVTSGDTPESWSTDVTDFFLGHGTHVTGTALGRGTLSDGRYRGSAPGADLYFYRVGDSTIAADDAIKSIVRALQMRCDVYSASWGFFTNHLDGSSSVCQAIDAAVSLGMTCVVAAGNDALGRFHMSARVDGNGSVEAAYTVDNSLGDSAYDRPECLSVIWRRSSPVGDVRLTASDLVDGESLALEFEDTSIRGTRGQRYRLRPLVPPGVSKTYRLTIENAAGCAVERLHVYRILGRGTFDDPDPRYMVLAPAIADDAIAVGAWTSRDRYTSSTGEVIDESGFLKVDTRAPFSSIGPRIDGRRKPDVVAPGAVTISCLDSVAFSLQTPEGRKLHVEDAGYAAFSGTSMATPLTAGVAALLLEESPWLTPAQIKLALAMTAGAASSPDDGIGYGLIDAVGAVEVAGEVPDGCDLGGRPVTDCNDNGLPDVCEVAGNAATDCNENGVPDGCDIASGASADCDLGGVPDECDLGGSFVPGERLDHVVGSRPRGLAAADLDADGAVDLAATNLLSHSVTVLLHLASGTSGPGAEFAVGEHPTAVVAADLDLDGDADLATANLSGGSVSILYNRGDGTFGDRVDRPVGNRPSGLVTAALDGNGTPDLAVVNNSSDDVTILFDPGGRAPGGALFVPVPAAPTSLAAGDVNGDGTTDLVVAAGDGVSVLVKCPGGEFSVAAAGVAGEGLSALALADLDGDDDLDLVTSRQSCGTVALLENDGAGRFQRVRKWNVDGGPLAVELADLDGNGRVDIATANRFSHDVTVLLNHGAHGFASGRRSPAGATPSGLAVADVDGNGKLDLLVANLLTDKVSLLPNGGAAATHEDCNGNGSPDRCDVRDGISRDVNLNGLPDECDPGPRFVRGDCDGDGGVLGRVTDAVFLLKFNFASGRRPACFAACDVNADGRVAGQVTDAIHLLLYNFASGAPPQPPFPDCWISPGFHDEELGCEVDPLCGG